jgi:hypothetical protein
MKLLATVKKLRRRRLKTTSNFQSKIPNVCPEIKLYSRRTARLSQMP